MLRYQVAQFETLSLRQKKYVYCLAQAAVAGRDILWDQNCRYNLALRELLEAIFNENESKNVNVNDNDNEEEWEAFVEYVRRVWFANGVHHHYSMDKFKPGFSEEWLRKKMAKIDFPKEVTDCMGRKCNTETLIQLIFDPDFQPKRVNQEEGTDLLQTSAMNYYAPNITQEEACRFYENGSDKEGEIPPMVGMNSRLEKDEEGNLYENTYKSGGLYGKDIDRIVGWLECANEVAENEEQKGVINKLIEFYRTGDLHVFDLYTILWVKQHDGEIDFTNGFTEVYGDPLGMKASWEGYVNIRDVKASERTRKLSENAQWFEDNSPTDKRFKKEECRGVSAKVVNVAMLGGDLYPASAIGINLPNSNYVRQHYGSKSVTLGNLTHAYDEAARGNGFYEEFVDVSQPIVHDSLLDDLHTDLHECLGHGSGKLLPGVSPDALGSYGSTIEEARADLFALYYIADKKMVELGLVPDGKAYQWQYYTYMMNGLLTQLVRIEPGKQIEEAHMRNRALIARWLLEKSGAMELVRHTGSSEYSECPESSEKSEGKTYLKISDYDRLRDYVGKLLAEVQRIKSEGDLEAARRLVEDYGVRVDARLHEEVLRRYRRLNLAPYKGFINPRYTLVRNENGDITDITIDYTESYDEQMMRYKNETQA